MPEGTVELKLNPMLVTRLVILSISFSLHLILPVVGNKRFRHVDLFFYIIQYVNLNL